MTAARIHWARRDSAVVPGRYASALERERVLA